jgi:hypothetical protein
MEGGGEKMGGTISRDELSLASSWELVSAYVNGAYGSDPALKKAMEEEFAARSLPLPAAGPAAPEGGSRPKPMSPETFLSYLLLIYTVTGLFYAWLYLPLRLIRGDFGKDRKHHLIQWAISLAYQGAEVGTYFLLDSLLSL